MSKETKENICGIYCIENLINNKKYIGQSVNIMSRWNYHKYSLNSNKHNNIHLQRAWNKYGEQNFDFKIIEQCQINDLDSREKYYISLYDTYINGYNRDEGGRSNKTLSDETKTLISYSKSQKIIQLDLKGNFIKEWNTARDACVSLGYRQEALYGNLCNLSKSYDGFIWVYKDIYESYDFDINKYIKNSIFDGKPKKVVQCNLNNDCIKIWDSIGDASKYCNVGRTKIGMACKKDSKYKIVASSYWYYIEDYLNGYRHIDNIKHTKSHNHITKHIDQYDLNNNFIQHFNSVKDASALLNISTDMISRVCRGVRNQTHGYIFKYAE